MAEAGAEADVETVVRQSDLPGWQQQAVLMLHRVDEDYGERIVAVPSSTEPGENYRVMQDFIATLSDPQLKESLTRAIQGRGAFGRFRSVLGRHFHAREQFQAFQQSRERERVLTWLTSLDIEPEDTSPTLAVTGSLRPAVRPHLLEGVLMFVREAARLEGVERIALFGSLATDAPSPEDADVLVSIRDDVPLSPLARVARRLNAHTMHLGRAGKVFLADPQGQYLGRTCPWKQCEPNLHFDCLALHCGQRQYLYDDLNNITLAASTIQTPPLELWPAVRVRETAPEDVEQFLLAPLRVDGSAKPQG